MQAQWAVMFKHSPALQMVPTQLLSSIALGLIPPDCGSTGLFLPRAPLRYSLFQFLDAK